jgi:hypothetical protein
MGRYVVLILQCLVLLWGSVACVPQQTRPPTLSEHGYMVTLHASSGPIWLNTANPPPGVHSIGELVVSVQDAQGRPVDGVLVEFQLGPSWAQSAAVVPQRAVTHDGSVRAIIEPRTSGSIPVIVRVDNVTQQARFVAQTPKFGPSGR